MNKQEFQQKMKNMKRPKFFTATTLDEAYEAGFEKAKRNALFNSYFLDEPEKPVVPQFVADWYESHKENFEWSLAHIGLDVMNGVFEDNTEMYDWLNNASNKPFGTLVKMKLYGYEVEKEKLYRARHKLTGEYLSQNYAKTGYYHSLDHFHILKLSKKDWEDLVVWGDSTYEIEEVEDD